MAREYLGHPLLDRLAEKAAPATTALIVVDMQNDFVHPDGYCARALGAASVSGFATVIEPMRRLCRAARAAGIHVVPRDAVGDNTAELARATDDALSRLLDPSDVVSVDELCRLWAASPGPAI